MKRTAPQSAPSGAEGFVLVGVIMFVLALTILGLSLFGLSSYETQFLNRSFDNAQAENTALGEAERAKYRLSVSPFLLQTAASNLPLGVTTLARQVQGGDTVATGAVDWDSGEPVLITVDATVKGITRRLEGRFNPTQRVNFYKRLVTSYGKVQVNDDVQGISRNQTVTLGGRVWQNHADTTWIEHVAAYGHGIRIGGVEQPGVPQFVTEHLASPFFPAVPMRSVVGSNVTFTFSSLGGDVAYFKVDPTWPEANDPEHLGNYYSFRSLSGISGVAGITLKVNGHCVWVVPKGIRFETHVTVQPVGLGDASLVIISPKNGLDVNGGDYKHVGVWFFGGLTSASVPVILASEGGVYLEQFYNPNSDTGVNALSIFAGRVFLTGPVPGHGMQLYHPSTMDDVVDWYALHDALPNTSPTGDHDLALVPGTWQMRTP